LEFRRVLFRSAKKPRITGYLGPVGLADTLRVRFDSPHLHKRVLTMKWHRSERNTRLARTLRVVGAGFAMAAALPHLSMVSVGLFQTRESPAGNRYFCSRRCTACGETCHS